MDWSCSRQCAGLRHRRDWQWADCMHGAASTGDPVAHAAAGADGDADTDAVAAAGAAADAGTDSYAAADAGADANAVADADVGGEVQA